MMIKRKRSIRGGRIGGEPPVGIRPKELGRGAQYLLTVPFAGHEISVFINGDRSSLATPVIQNQGTWFRSGNGVVEAIAHAPAPRVESSSLESELSPRALVVGPEQADVDETDPRFPLDVMKLGGTPYFHQNTMESHEEVERLAAVGFSQWLQLSLPSAADDPIEGSWPFAECNFHLFGRPVPTGIEWIYFWS
jgi:hypothetical protein